MKRKISQTRNGGVVRKFHDNNNDDQKKKKKNLGNSIKLRKVKMETFPGNHFQNRKVDIVEGYFQPSCCRVDY